jgi:hypothetical protein
MVAQEGIAMAGIDGCGSGYTPSDYQIESQSSTPPPSTSGTGKSHDTGNSAAQTYLGSADLAMVEAKANAKALEGLENMRRVMLENFEKLRSAT